ncbi:MAG: ABC transporter permease [Acidobacteria bacterium]|nr:ABC transporter permease [Acidobacteriota bacterium]
MLSFFYTFAARIRGFLRKGELESDFDQELAAHLRMAEEDGLRRGLTVEEARRAARVQLGGITQLRESWREAWGLPWLDGFALDVKLGLRMLRRSWGLTLAGGLAMTIVITIAAVVFVFLDEFMGRTSPPLDEGERVVALQSWDAQAHRRREMSRRDLERWGATLQSVQDLGGFQTVECRLKVESRPAEWVRVAEITASGFRLARVQPLLGRWIADADERLAAPPVVVIGYDVWQSRFASDPAVIGQTVRLGEILHTVVGVMPERFAFPVNHRYWTPLRSDPSGSLKPAPQGAVFARLAPGVSLDGAQAELTTIGLLPPATRPPSGDARRPRVVPYTFAFTDDVERGELAWQQRIILLLVSLLLVPPCLNIAILIYARTVTRQEEFAARFALGASRSRIVVQLCVEVLVLSSAAGAMALVLTRPILTQIGEIIRRFPELGGSLPFWVDFDFSWRAALFVAGLTVVAALIAGLAPALQATGRVLPTALRSLGSRTGIPLGATWTALLVAQVALALAALPSTIELAWGHLRPAVLGPGFAAREFLTARLAVDPQSVPAAEANLTAFASRLRSLQAEVIRQIQAEAGTSAVTFAASFPGAEPLMFVEMDEGVAGGRPVRRYVRTNQVDRAFFTVFDVPALAGRTFDGRDFGSAATAIVDQTFVRQVVGGDNAIGRRVRPVPAPGSEAGPWYEIVGIVPDRPANTSQGRMYVPAMTGARRPASPIQLALRAGPDPAAMSRRLQDIVTNLHPTLRLDDVRRLDEVLGETQISSNLTSYALVIVTLSVLILSAAGLYALMSFTVTLRRREIGIRTALGAPPWRLLASIFARALWQIAAGVVVGVTAALVLHRWLNIEVEGGWHIPGILPAAAIFILTIGLLSAAGPARRAVRVDPTEALRNG